MPTIANREGGTSRPSPFAEAVPLSALENAIDVYGSTKSQFLAYGIRE
jgi:hypothetical protein